ncbi:unnamed protein product [Chrysodeixis includens]|uniref:Uncharacterized protein n=1 Tax=Chrysodeixis includens TaxID=689277 RepID=A0A9N8PY13_CHRIL|nr:unnamed protein product [Chrysodeixis includens]
MTVREATASEHRRANGRDRASVRGRLSTSTGFSGCPQCTRHSLEQRQNGHERARRTADGPAASAHTCVPHSLFPARHARAAAGAASCPDSGVTLPPHHEPRVNDSDVPHYLDQMSLLDVPTQPHTARAERAVAGSM